MGGKLPSLGVLGTSFAGKTLGQCCTASLILGYTNSSGLEAGSANLSLQLVVPLLYGKLDFIEELGMVRRRKYLTQ